MGQKVKCTHSNTVLLCTKMLVVVLKKVSSGVKKS